MKKNILYIAFTDKTTDSRTRDLLKVSKLLGNVFYIGLSNDECNEKNALYIKKRDSKIVTYILFCYTVLKYAYGKKIDILFIDNYHGCFLEIFLRFISKFKFVIQDVRELYLYNDLPTIYGKALLWFEKRIMKKANVVICPNVYRANICKGLFDLPQVPLVFENIHWLKHNFSSKRNKYIKIAITDGLSKERMTDAIIGAVDKLGEKYHFYICGHYTENDIQYLKRSLKGESMDKIHFMGVMDYSELGEFLPTCDIGIVKYNYNNLNNIFCASGKLYEFVMAGLPVVTTEQIELKDICKKKGIGEADNSFVRAIELVANNIDYYRDNVLKFQKEILSRDYIKECATSIKEKIDRNGFDYTVLKRSINE